MISGGHHADAESCAATRDLQLEIKKAASDMSSMANFLLALFESVLDGYLVRTGRKALSLFGWKSNSFIEVLIGLVIWVIVGWLLLLAVTAALGNTMTTSMSCFGMSVSRLNEGHPSRPQARHSSPRGQGGAAG
jgi:hypothetical protein